MINTREEAKCKLDNTEYNIRGVQKLRTRDALGPGKAVSYPLVKAKFYFGKSNLK